jgi:hypothetical protein
MGNVPLLVQNNLGKLRLDTDFMERRGGLLSRTFFAEKISKPSVRQIFPPGKIMPFP